jgi:UDP-N-acetylmuramoyl-tripeptide--D-alanyl-D-alanine ligase
VDIVLTVGAAAYQAGGVGVSDNQSAVAWLKEHLSPGDTVLLKASRAAGLDTVARGLARIRRAESDGR